MLKKIFKSFFGPIRIGVNGNKTLLFLWLKKDLSKIYDEIGVDLAGGSMLNRKFFKTKKYICVDINQDKLNEGLLLNKDATAVNSKIENFMSNVNQKKPNLIVCVQTMGVNTNFNHEKTLEVIKMMFKFLENDGCLIFNLGNKVNLKIIEEDLKIFFKNKFQTIEIRPYGAFKVTSKKPYHFSLRFLIAFLMDIFPPLRTFFGLKKNNLYYFCKNKKIT
tara:strand:- start:777 stop:1433 length:657 start_codon:yes stop_codon:yes gene_type:complete